MDAWTNNPLSLFKTPQGAVCESNSARIREGESDESTDRSQWIFCPPQWYIYIDI